MFSKFVFVTGALDYPIGLAAIAAAVADPIPGSFVGFMTLGAFLIMAAACLVWASKDVVNRSPVIFWQGFVRLTAAGSVVYAVPNGLSESWEYSLVVFDGIIAMVYIFGSMKVTGNSFIDQILCKPAKAA